MNIQNIYLFLILAWNSWRCIS